jgi:type IV pilus assembly protein PilV
MRRPSAYSAPRRRAGGATLIEVLVSVVVVAVGLLGAAALLSSALRNNQASYERSQMTVLGQGMLDAMRANLTGVDAGAYQKASYMCSAPSGSGLANADIARWIGDLQAQINASACGSISCVGRQCTVSIRWDDSRGSGGSSAFQYVIVSRL